MLPREILKEYNTEKTAQNFGNKLFLRYFQDLEQTPGAQTVTGIPMDIWLRQNELQEKIDNPETYPENKVKLEQTLEKLKNGVVLKLLKTFEDVDPTNKKEYVQWLVRTYINDQMSIEDIGSTIAEYLDKFNTLKIKRHIKPPKNDIGQYKDFNGFMNEVDQYQDPLAVGKEKQAERGKYEVIYDADNLLVLKPKDKTAACFFGRGTRWCTAATRGRNYFNHYNRQGPMYIIIPRKPDHPGEKYQFHFDSSQYAEESDRMLKPNELIALVDKHPQLADIFREQAETRGLFWLQKPVIKKDEKYTLYIYKKNSKPYLRVVPKEPSYEGEEYYIEKDYNDNVEIKNERNKELSPIEKYNFAEKMPELIEKLGINIDGYDPKSAQRQEFDGKTSVRFGDRYVIVNASDGQYLVSGGQFGNLSDRYSDKSRGVYLYDPKDDSYRSDGYKSLNPYDFMIKHPELNTTFQDMLNQIQNDTETMSRRHGDNGSWTYGWMAPHSSVKMQNGTVYEFGQNGKPISYYIRDDNNSDQGFLLSMDPNGKVDSIRTIDSTGRDQTMTFLQQVAFLDQYPELKELLPNIDSFNPKEIDLGNAILKEYHTEKNRDRQEIRLTKNYFLIPKEPEVPGERYAISITNDYNVDQATDELTNRHFKNAKIYAFTSNRLAPIDFENKRGSRYGASHELPGFVNYLISRFPKLSEYLDVEDTLIHGQWHSGRGGKFVLGSTIDNDRVKIQRFDKVDLYGNQHSHGMPKLLVTEKKTGDTYVVTTEAKDQRGKTGKIGSISVTKVPNKLINWDAPEDEYPINTAVLKDADIISLFRKYPEMVDIIKQENIHPKSPHPALVKVADADEELQVKTDTFRVERNPENTNQEYIFFKDENKNDMEVLFPDSLNRYGTQNLPTQISVNEIEKDSRGNFNNRNKIEYGTHAWYNLINSDPEFKEYINNRVKNGPAAIVGAGQPTEVKTILNAREYIFDANDGKLLYFTPITNPVKGSPEDTADNTWFRNGLIVPLTSKFSIDHPTLPVYLDNNLVRKEIQDQADEVHSKYDDYGSELHAHLADTTATVPEDLNTNQNLYTIKKVGTKSPIYKFMWNVDPEVVWGYGGKMIAPSSQYDLDRAKERGETYPNPELVELFVKLMKEIPSAYGRGTYDSLLRSKGVYVRPETGEVGIIEGDNDLHSLIDRVKDSPAITALYKNIPEIKKLLTPKKAKSLGTIPEQTRKLQTTMSDDDFYLTVTKKPKGIHFAGHGWGIRSKLDPGTVYNILYKDSQGNMRILNTLYFPDKGPVVIFDNRGDKETYTTDQKIGRFLDRFPELKELLQPFAKSNKWLRESSEDIVNYLLTESELVYDYFDETTVEEIDPYLNLLENELAESLGDLAWAKKRSQEVKQAKKEWKPNYHFVKPGELAGSYTDQQMKDMGFKMASSGNWYMPATKFQDLIKSGKLREDEQAILEGKKLPRTSEFLQVKQDLMRLAGISEQKGDDSMGSNISYTASKISKTMKDKNIQPGTDEWFRLWFAKPYLTGEKPFGE